jgi:KaiC/GvpD/RAD55 family RecA-like ATPase
MNELRVTDIAYPGLAHVFAPPGIRLVEKSAGGVPTTSVLVRGAAGTGKTTLGLAIAHALARASGGIVLYLATEATLADAIYKVSMLKVADAPVAPYSADVPFAPGTITLEHLVVANEEAAEADPSRLAELVIDLADELVSARAADAPVRALVVDSFELPEGRDRVHRSALAAFVQSLESRGVSPVFLEEVGRGTSERLTFVVDTVFELTLATEPPEAALRRKLAVRKSRFAEAVAGPHDMVMDQGVPAVWPDSPSLDFGPPCEPLGFVVPQRIERRMVVSIGRGALVLSRYDTDGQQVNRSFWATPGLVSVNVDCGPFITVGRTGEGISRVLPATFGPNAMTWAIHHCLASAPANAVYVTRLEYLLTQPRFAIAIPGLLKSLARRGLLVCVHGRSSGLETIDEIADYTGPSGHWLIHDEVAPFQREYRAATAWSTDFPSLPFPVGAAVSQSSLLAASVTAARAKIQQNDLIGARAELELDSQANEAGVQWRVIESALVLDRLGASALARSRLDRIKTQKAGDPNVRAALGWAYAETGAEWEAFSLALEGIDAPTPSEAVGRLWRAACLRYSRAPQGLRFMMREAVLQAQPLESRFSAQSIAQRQAIMAADQVLIRTGGSADGTQRRLARLLADVRLESPDPEHWRDAEARYEALVAAGDLPLIERADIAFNRGVISERLGDTDAAIARYREALGLNPLLEMARGRLEAHGIRE